MTKVINRQNSAMIAKEDKKKL